MKSLKSFRSAYSHIGQKLDNARISASIRRSLELVRTCHRDLQYLIDLRDENLDFLQMQPKVLDRLNIVIETAHNGLIDACRIVEKSRPEAHSGKTPFYSRVEWVFGDSSEFQSQQPVICRHHASVLAELSFLRQLLLLPRVNAAPSDARQPTLPKSDSESPIDFENIALLGDLMGDITVRTTTITARRRVPESPNPPIRSVKQIDRTMFSDLPEPVIPNALPQRVNETVAGMGSVQMRHLRTRRSTAPASMQGAREKTIVIDPSERDSLALLLGDASDNVSTLSIPYAPRGSPLPQSRSLFSICSTMSCETMYDDANKEALGRNTSQGSSN